MNEQKEEGDKYVPLPTVWVWHDPAHGPCWGRWISCSRHCWKRPALDTAKKKRKKSKQAVFSARHAEFLFGATPPARRRITGGARGARREKRGNGCSAGARAGGRLLVPWVLPVRGLGAGMGEDWDWGGRIARGRKGGGCAFWLVCSRAAGRRNRSSGCSEDATLSLPLTASLVVGGN